MFAGSHPRRSTMRIAANATILLVFCCVARAGDDAKAHLKRLQGKWQVTSAISRGEKIPAEDIAELLLTIDGEKITIRDKDKVQDRMTCKLDPSKKPAAIDFTHTEGANKGKTDHAIYKLDGDVLTICVNEKSGEERPSEFASKAGSSHSLIVLKRAK